MSRRNAQNHNPCASKAPEALQNVDDSEAPSGPARGPALKDKTNSEPLLVWRRLANYPPAGKSARKSTRGGKATSGAKGKKKKAADSDYSDEAPPSEDDYEDDGDDEVEKGKLADYSQRNILTSATRRAIRSPVVAGKPNPLESRETKIASDSLKSKKANLVILESIASCTDHEAVIAEKEANDMKQRQLEVYAAYENKLSDLDLQLFGLEMTRFSPEVREKQATTNSLEARAAYLEYTLKKAEKKKDKAENKLEGAERAIKKDSNKKQFNTFVARAQKAHM
ncbi:hypothetical protein FRC09_005048 [Ceratobasidium sp. 395]|nr:hypothetical protein FRC09_005048 [Ceratobasidium sp. 395]